MKRLVTVIAVVAAMFVFTTQESQAQFYGGRGISIGIGSGGFGGFNNGFGGYGGGFNRGYGGFGSPIYGGGFNRGISYNSFRPSYGRSYYQPSRSYYGGGGGFYRGGGGRGCGY